MLCKYCGASLEDDVHICTECGKSQTEEPVEETVTQEPAEESVAAEPAAEEAAQEPVEESFEEPAPAVAAPAKKARKPRKKPHILLRIPLQLISLLLCIVLLAVSLCTALLADVNTITSSGGINKLINALLMPASAASAPHRFIPGAVGVLMDSTEPSLDLDDLFDEDGNIQLPGDILGGDSSEDAVSGLLDFVLDALEDTVGELPVSKEEISQIVEDSTLTEFVSDKLASYAQDVINGTSDTVITTEEIMDLVTENKDLIEEVFDVEITEEMTEQIQQQVDDILVKEDINKVIHENITTMVEDMVKDSLPPLGDFGTILGGSGGFGGLVGSGSGSDTDGDAPMSTIDQYRLLLSTLSSTQTTLTAVGACVVLMLLLCLLNWYNVPAGLTWSAFPLIISGLILSAPIYVVQQMPELLGSLAGGDLSMVIQVVGSFAGVLAPIHYGVLAVGVALLVISIVWRIVRGAARRRAARAAV